MEKLIEWKSASRRKPLLLKGARQTGKTWILKEFGKKYFNSVAYIDLLASSRARDIFSGDFDMKRIISSLSIETRCHIEPGKTLIVLDEIQEAPRALTSLKYFFQDAPEFHIAAAGSYLGIAKHKDISFPVGKVNILSLEPLSFFEFLDAIDEGITADLLRAKGAAGIDPAITPKLKHHLKEYFFVGGMPDAVKMFAATHNYSDVRNIQDEILEAYDLDFSKHAPARILERMRLVWKGLPTQLARENKKFMYGAVRPGARARDFEESIQWLVDYGAVRRVSRCSALRIPLGAYCDLNAFKLFCLDIGLLGALAHINEHAILEGSKLFTEFKGALTEQYVCQQLDNQKLKPLYWSAQTGRAEIDFSIEMGGVPIPIEVKASENLQSKSLKIAKEKFNLPICIRTSLSPYHHEDWVSNIPLWAIGSLSKTISPK